ncbi:MAG TPA: endonuclease/exonuclease/phosphatase family protein [Solirubrobacteraceae bacterium]
MSELLTWNVAGRVTGVAEQATALAERAADVVCLQEVRAPAAPAWRELLGELGYAHAIATLEPGDVSSATPPTRRLGVLTAARTPLARATVPALPWPERHLAVEVDGVVVHNLHAPVSQKAGQVKVRTLEAIAAQLAAARDPVVLAGDLNTPQYESREGEVRSFARTRGGAIRPDRGERHDRAELGIVPGLAEHGFVDAFRAVNGYAARDRSWLYRHGKMGYRLDHIFVRGLRVEACAYVHTWRERRLSDHSALWARLEA